MSLSNRVAKIMAGASFCTALASYGFMDYSFEKGDKYLTQAQEYLETNDNDAHFYDLTEGSFHQYVGGFFIGTVGMTLSGGVMAGSLEAIRRRKKQ